MTIKTFMKDGRIVEYPNATIYWEWDDNEEGTDSGYRIHTMDKNYTSAQAFVYPSECNKIEITSEESDRVFKALPFESGISPQVYRIAREISAERQRQNDKWGEQNHILTNDPKNDAILAEIYKRINQSTEEVDNWKDIILEEVFEACAEPDHDKARVEWVQVAAVAVQIIEYIDRQKEKSKNK